VSGIVDPARSRRTPRCASARGGGHRRAGERLALVQQLDRITYANGDQSTTSISSSASGCRATHPADGELTEVDWFALSALPDVDDFHRRKIAAALSGEASAVFFGGR
jgi:hypothetical protein